MAAAAAQPSETAAPEKPLAKVDINTVDIFDETSKKSRHLQYFNSVFMVGEMDSSKEHQSLKGIVDSEAFYACYKWKSDDKRPWNVTFYRFDKDCCPLVMAFFHEQDADGLMGAFYKKKEAAAIYAEIQRKEDFIVRK
jgi:hypothetical protein